MKAAVVTKAGGEFEIQEREIPQPGFGESTDQSTSVWDLF
jgi:hypothetical protein